MNPTVVVDQQCRTGEGPIWHPDEQCLYWLDIPESKLFRHDPATGAFDAFDTGEPVGGYTIQEDGELLLFMARGAVKEWRAGVFGRTVIEELPEERENRFNDVIADPEGRVFCGVMSTEARAGRLYRLDLDGSIHTMLEGTGTANGMGFTPDLTQMYFCDSRKARIFVFDYDRATGDLSNQRVLVEPADGEGRPDGMTVDADGNIWSARWDGARVVKISPAGKVLDTVMFPARNVSCVTFGGPEYTEMYATTAGGQDRAENGEMAGSLFKVVPGVRGVPEFRSRIG